MPLKTMRPVGVSLLLVTTACGGGGSAPLDPEPATQVVFGLGMSFSSEQKVIDPATGDSVPRVTCQAGGDLVVERASLSSERLRGRVTTAGQCRAGPHSQLFDVEGPSGPIWEGRISGSTITFQLMPVAGEPSLQLCDFAGSILERSFDDGVPIRMEGSATCRNPPDYDVETQEIWSWAGTRRGS